MAILGERLAAAGGLGGALIVAVAVVVTRAD